MDPTMLPTPEHYSMLQDIAGVGGAYSNILPAPSTVSLDRATVRKSADEEEMEDAEDSPEWAVRVGDAPPPSWGKRKASDDGEKDVNKKGRFHEDSTPDANMNDPSLHVIDQNIRQIARDYRFTVEEVQEYYDKCGEMALTQSRFQKMREELQAKF
jgi:chemotaxis protein histidine kinase CheA